MVILKKHVDDIERLPKLDCPKLGLTPQITDIGRLVRGLVRGENPKSKTFNLEIGLRFGPGDLERRWVLLKIPRCDIDGVGEGK